MMVLKGLDLNTNLPGIPYWLQSLAGSDNAAGQPLVVLVDPKTPKTVIRR